MSVINKCRRSMKLSSVLLAVVITVRVLQSSSLSYIVYLGGLNHELEASQIKDSHFEFLGSILGSKERVDEASIYSYNKQFNGFAAILDEEDASKVAEHPNVVSVIQNKGINLHTTRSWDFLKLVDSSTLWPKANYGENIIIANIDTGVWPESKSFSGEGYGPIPSKWKGGCDNQTLVPCNK
ncbi:subtilisin-like protease SBT5.4 [Bidens hawaiensis]|uniref:subtilisin-like protease SBT5.4 n=1 Tax=Bidens hawaiensis TaxID=980011 RepID=UPI00404AB908